MISNTIKPPRTLRDIKGITLDVATLFSIENPWFLLKRYTKSFINSFEMAYILGSIKAEYEALHREITLLTSSLGHEKVDKFLEDVFYNIPFIPSIECLLKWLSGLNLKVAILGGAPRPIVNRIFRILNRNLVFYDEIWIKKDSKG
ncbi:MAG TPA: hypothetical protein ENI59_01970, partial [Euryarchaeota archaeon]|nr:hypothetical protein [Euryarchaeota archaeon]